MPANAYHFVTRWTIPGTVNQVYTVLNNVSGYPRWWPQLAAKFHQLHCGDCDGVGARGAVTTKGFLPYVLKWEYIVTSAKPPHEVSINACGDIEGVGHWKLLQNGDVVDIMYEWKVSGKKAILRYLSPILRPLFSWNHNWVMKKGMQSLQRELKRTRSLIA